MSIPNCWDNGKEIDHTKYICLAPIGSLDNHDNYDAPLDTQITDYFSRFPFSPHHNKQLPLQNASF